jgi:hypothetical protein
MILYRIMKETPSFTFNFSFIFNPITSTPFFPSACHERDGFSFGLQSPNLYEAGMNLDDWFSRKESVWQELIDEFSQNDDQFIGIDSSIAPLFNGSFLGVLRSLAKQESVTIVDESDPLASIATSGLLTGITSRLRRRETRVAGMCGLFMPALEDFALADQYEKGNFSIERNVFVSLHSGLGIDTYPIGIDQCVERVVNILECVQSLSNKFDKSLSVRFVSDGKVKTKIGVSFSNYN